MARILGCSILLTLLAISCPAPEGEWRSALYPEDWSTGFADSQGRFLHDFSFAGYRNGADLPKNEDKAKFDVTDYGADNTGTSDATAGIQLAIDAAENAGGGIVFIQLPRRREERGWKFASSAGGGTLHR